MLNKSILIASSNKSVIKVNNLMQHFIDPSTFFEAISTCVPITINEENANDKLEHFRVRSTKTNQEVDIYSTASCAKLHDLLHPITQRSDVNIIDVTQNCFTEKLFDLWKKDVVKNREKWTIALVDTFKEADSQGNKLVFDSTKNIISLRKHDIMQESVNGCIDFYASNLPQIVHTMLFKPCINIIAADEFNQNKSRYMENVLTKIFSDLMTSPEKCLSDVLPIFIIDQQGENDIRIFYEITNLYRKRSLFFLVFWGAQDEKSRFKKKLQDFMACQSDISHNDEVNILRKVTHIDSLPSIVHFVESINRELYDNYYYINDMANFEQPDLAEKYIKEKISNISFPCEQVKDTDMTNNPIINIHGSSIGAIHTGNVNQSNTSQNNNLMPFNEEFKRLESILKTELSDNSVKEQALAELSEIKDLLNKLDKEDVGKSESRKMLEKLLSSSKKKLDALKTIKGASESIEWGIDTLSSISTYLQSLS